ncbi:MAG: hypothetical protein ACOC7K_00905, partial [bacterium]
VLYGNVASGIFFNDEVEAIAYNGSLPLDALLPVRRERCIRSFMPQRQTMFQPLLNKHHHHPNTYDSNT